MTPPGRSRRRKAPGSRDLVGRDLARVRIPHGRGSRPLAALLIGALIAGMGLVALRTDILRLRYALAESIEIEKALLEEQRIWTARRQTLLHPARLAKLARQRGFSRPLQVIHLRPLRLASSSRP